MHAFFANFIADPIGSLTVIVATVAVFSIVIFVHEFGHFLVAKKSGVKVEEFAFGFGPKLFSFQMGETLYALNLIPLGGYNKFAGEVADDYDGPVLEGQGSKQIDGVDHSRDFLAQPWHRRILIALAGPFMNYLLAIFFFFLMLQIWGEPIQTNKTQIGEVVAGMPAEMAGLKTGDYVLDVQGEPVGDFQSIASKIHVRPGLATDIRIKRDNLEQTIQVTPTNGGDNGVGLIGIRPADPIETRNKIGAAASLKKSVWQCWNISRFTLMYLGQKIVAREKPDMAGPIGITQVIVKAVKTGMEDLMYLVAMISVAIGLFNLFPIPLLDGGHVVYYLIEGATRRPVSQKIVSKVNMVGLVILMSLLAFATLNDVQRIIHSRQKTTTVQK